MQPLDKAIWDGIVTRAAFKAFRGFPPRAEKWRHKRMDAALKQALSELGITLAELP